MTDQDQAALNQELLALAIHPTMRPEDFAERLTELIENGADIDAQDHAGRSAALWAAHRDNEAMIDFLTHAGADVDAPSDSGYTPLGVFAMKGNVDACETLLIARADPNKPDQEGRAPMGHAARSGNVALVRAMLNAGGDPLRPDHRGHTPILTAAGAPGGELGLLEMVARVGKVGPSLPDGRSALHLVLAASPPKEVGDPGKHAAPLQVVQKLVRAGASPGAPDGRGNRPLHLAASHAAAEVVEFLATRGAPLNALDGQGHTELMRAAAAGAGASVEALLRRGVDATITSPDGRSAFHFALEAGRENGAARMAGVSAARQALAEAIEDPNALDAFGFSALHQLILHDEPALVARQLERQADPNLPTGVGDTPLTLAIEMADLSGTPQRAGPMRFGAIDALLASGADANRPGALGLPPLAMALGTRLRPAPAGSPLSTSREELCARLALAGANLDAPGLRDKMRSTGLDIERAMAAFAGRQGASAAAATEGLATPAGGRQAGPGLAF